MSENNNYKSVGTKYCEEEIKFEYSSLYGLMECLYVVQCLILFLVSTLIDFIYSRQDLCMNIF